MSNTMEPQNSEKTTLLKLSVAPLHFFYFCIPKCLTAVQAPSAVPYTDLGQDQLVNQELQKELNNPTSTLQLKPIKTELSDSVLCFVTSAKENRDHISPKNSAS